MFGPVSRRASVVLLLSLSVPCASHAEPNLSLRDAVARARQQALAIAIAQARVAEAKAGVAAADVVAATNPALEVLLGPRWNGGVGMGGEVSLVVPVERGGKRAARLSLAQATLLREEQAVEVARSEAAVAVAEAWLRLIHGRQQMALAQGALALVSELSRVAAERARAGGVAQLVVNLAESERAQVLAELADAQSAAVAAEADLRLALAMPTDATLQVDGTLAEAQALVPPRWTGDPLDPMQRPDLQLLRRDVDAAGARAVAATAARAQDVGLIGRWARDEAGHAVVAGISVPLPLFQNAAGNEAMALAQARRAALELACRAQMARAEVARAVALRDRARLAAQIVGDHSLRRLTDNESLAVAGYQAGKLDLQPLLFLRRSIVELRRKHLNRQLDAALAAVRLWAALGAP